MKWRRYKWPLVIFLFFGLPLLYLAAEHFYGTFALARWKKALSAKGEKLDVDDCIPFRAAANDENRFRSLMSATRQISGRDLTRLTPPALRPVAPGKIMTLRWVEEWPPALGNAGKRGPSKGETNANWRMLADELATRRDVLQEVKALLHEPVLDPQLDYHLGFNLMLPHLAPLKGLAQQLNAEALLEMHQGRLDPAADDIKAILAITHVLEPERLVISQLVRNAIQGIALGTTWQALQTPGWTDPQLAELQQAWQTMEFLEPMVHAFEMERACAIETYAVMRGSTARAAQLLDLASVGNSSSANSNGSISAWLALFDGQSDAILLRGLVLPAWQFAWSHQDELHYLKTLQIHLNACRTSARDRSARATREAELQIQARNENFHGVARLRYLAYWQLMVAFERSMNRAFDAEAQRELVLAALAIKRYELTHGKPPETLSQLIPQFLAAPPRDYWSGQSLLYHLGAGGKDFTLYSVGKNGTDDGGDAQPEPSSSPVALSNGRDLVWPVAATKEEVADALSRK